ncbi:hypothetical protein [Spirosoma endophyticum]|uniref:Uncharacterized protein n=1 Tax=Spirosoma endophyticum TaxID=662367 RepID=A0A1I2CNC0_9BACT|nr:hypothetical protein [Spirosoma endophyticum]SFE69889.1 hypothetical protein SAMN05216167_1183 [Spirosoma endophyticum]
MLFPLSLSAVRRKGAFNDCYDHTGNRNATFIRLEKEFVPLLRENEPTLT